MLPACPPPPGAQSMLNEQTEQSKQHCLLRVVAKSRSYLINDWLCNCRSVRAACAVCDGLSIDNFGASGLMWARWACVPRDQELHPSPASCQSHSKSIPAPTPRQALSLSLGRCALPGPPRSLGFFPKAPVFPPHWALKRAASLACPGAACGPSVI